MAEQRGQNRRNGKGSLSGREVIQLVRRDLPALLGRPIESILGLERSGGDGEGDGWSVTVQVVELSRIPHSTDVLGAYSVTLDRDGELTGYSRRRRYYRNQTDED
jgi:Gas vesicle synthesis protein GvpO